VSCVAAQPLASAQRWGVASVQAWVLASASGVVKPGVMLAQALVLSWDPDAVLGRSRHEVLACGKVSVLVAGVGFPFSKRLYKLRWRIEGAFNRLKDFRRIATRYDKLARNYLASVCLAAALVWWV
jgi:hypothetical protein